MRIVVIGATGNVGTSLLPMLSDDPEVDRVVGVARRPPNIGLAKLSWRAADIAVDDLGPIVADADVCVHLAWEVQPSHDEFAMSRTNVRGTARLLEAVIGANVSALVYASSVGAYAHGPKDRAVDESWPATGIANASYSRQKATVETMLDVVESARPDLRLVRMRPSLILKRGQAAEATRFFLGRLVPRTLLRPDRVPIVPDIAGLRFQVTHTDDVARAFHRAIVEPVRGAFNLAADPVLDPQTIARALGARTVGIPPAVARAGAELVADAPAADRSRVARDGPADADHVGRPRTRTAPMDPADVIGRRRDRAARWHRGGLGRGHASSRAPGEVALTARGTTTPRRSIRWRGSRCTHAERR